LGNNADACDELEWPVLGRDDAWLEERIAGRDLEKPPRRPERIEDAVDDRGIAFPKDNDANALRHRLSSRLANLAWFRLFCLSRAGRATSIFPPDVPGDDRIMK
jgi:hypothetical protein